MAAAAKPQAECPVCATYVQQSDLEAHVNACLDLQFALQLNHGNNENHPMPNIPGTMPPRKAESPAAANCWTTVSRRSAATKRAAASGGSSDTSVLEVASNAQEMMATFKTKACERSRLDAHDWRLCAFFHRASDTRRNPFKEFYSPDDDGVSGAERAYHPLKYRTLMCPDLRSCAYGEHYCAFAHSENQLRARGDYHFVPDEHHATANAPPPLKEYISDQQQRALDEPTRISPTIVLANMWRPQRGVGVSTQVFELTSLTSFMYDGSPAMRRAVQEAASALCKVAYVKQTSATGSHQTKLLHITGKADLALSALEAIGSVFVSPPASAAILDSKSLHPQAVALIKTHLGTEATQTNLQAMFVPRSWTNRVFLQFDDRNIIDGGLRICVLAVTGGNREQSIIADTFERVDSWLREHGGYTLIECSCCMEIFTRHQGVFCPGPSNKQHFWCTGDADDGGDGCFGQMVETQLPVIQAQNGCLLCPICKEPFVIRALGKSRLSNECFTSLQTASIDAIVATQYQQLQTTFDERLQRKVEELLQKYSSIGALEKEKAKLGAYKARNEALNLACPWCKTVYDEFEGCMALKCSTCDKSFCGYCHKQMNTSTGAHNHVRECNANLSSNGSYFASQEQIRDAQRRYRIKTLKAFLRRGNYKKPEQNAIVIEMTNDLTDLGIDPAALLDVGNLQNADE